MDSNLLECYYTKGKMTTTVFEGRNTTIISGWFLFVVFAENEYKIHPGEHDFSLN
jgi:hypothetical protein